MLWPVLSAAAVPTLTSSGCCLVCQCSTVGILAESYKKERPGFGRRRQGAVSRAEERRAEGRRGRQSQTAQVGGRGGAGRRHRGVGLWERGRQQRPSRPLPLLFLSELQVEACSRPSATLSSTAWLALEQGAHSQQMDMFNML